MVKPDLVTAYGLKLWNRFHGKEIEFDRCVGYVPTTRWGQTKRPKGFRTHTLATGSN